MGKKSLEDLRWMLCGELDEIAEKQDLSAGDLDTVHKLTDTIKNIDKITMLDQGYSEDVGWEARGTYDRGSSYGRRMYGGRYSRYSREDGRTKMMEQMEEMERQADGKEKEIIRRAISEMRGA